MIRKIAAHYLYISKDALFKYGIVTFDKEGRILDVVNTHGVPQEIEKLEFFNGLIVPGFVNIDIADLHPDCVIVNANNVGEFLRISLGGTCKYLVLENPECIEKADFDRLVQLENNGISIILKFGNNKGNDQSFIFKRIYNLQKSLGIRFSDILPWVTINPAKAMRIEASSGSIERNKKPGLNVITGIDYQTLQLKENSSVRVIY